MEVRVAEDEEHSGESDNDGASEHADHHSDAEDDGCTEEQDLGELAADGAAEHMIVQAPARPLPPLPWSDWQPAWSKRHTRFYWWSSYNE